MKCRRTRLNSEVIYSGKDSNCRKDTRQKEEGRQTNNNWRKNVSTKVFRVRTGFKVWEYHLGTEAVLRQYSQIFKVKIYSGTDNFQTTKRQLELHIM